MTDRQGPRGGSNSRAGLDFQRDCATWLRTDGPAEYANAWHFGRFPPAPHLGDLSGVGDRLIECGKVPWDEVVGKLIQAEQDARARGIDEFAVWKPVRGAGIGRGVMVMRAAGWWRMAAELDGLRRSEIVMHENGARG